MRKRTGLCIRIQNKNIDLLFVATLSLNIVVASINHIVNIFVPGTPVDSIVCYVLFAFVLLISLPSIIPRLNRYSFVVLLTGLILFLVAFIRTETRDYASKYFSTFLFQMIPLFVLGSTLDSLENIERLLDKILPAITILCVLYFVSDYIRGVSFQNDNMAFAYWLLPFTIYSIIRCFKKHFSILSLLIPIILVVCQILTGTRGPFVCIVASILFYILFSNSKIAIKILVVLLGLAIAAYLSSDLFGRHISDLASTLSSIGIENRTIIKIMSGEFLESVERNDIAVSLWNYIKQEPILGYGFLGDRGLLIGHSYPHNIILELLCQFGFILGGGVMVALTAAVVKMLKRNKGNIIVLILVSSSFIKLFFSGTYITEELLFVLLGVMLNRNLSTSLVSDEKRKEKAIIYSKTDKII